MLDKKLTDSEITVKALKEILELMLCEGDLQRTSTISHTIDLINRLQESKEYYKKSRDECLDKVEFIAKQCDELQAENKRLSTLAELGKQRANDYRVMRDRALKAEAENKELKQENEILFREVKMEVDNREKTKAEAYKEFAERLKMRAINRYNEFEDYQEYPYATITHIDELLKELVGE